MDIDVHKDVLSWINGDATNAVLIAEHPHNDLLVCDSHGFHYFDPVKEKTRRPRGLTSPMAELFWPEQVLPAVKSSHRPVVANGRPNAQSAARGMLRGNIIHGQIEALVSLDAERFHRKYAAGAHPWSYGALDALLKQGIRPLASELGVVAVKLGIATNVDMVGVRRDGTLVFIEWKTGYEGDAWTSAKNWMRGPLRGVLEDTAKNRAIVQVILGAMIAYKSRGLRGRIECIVAHISSQGTEFIPVTAEFMQTVGPVMYRALAAHQKARRDEYTAEKGRRALSTARKQSGMVPKKKRKKPGNYRRVLKN